MSGEKVLVAAHGNSLRALVMILEKLDTEQILKREIVTGQPMIFRLKADTTVESSEMLTG
jgi:2,3-bisphosphoglycerate-dependent phosphoglycerate mutase